MKIGQSKDTSAYVAKNYFDLEDGESVFRILPALGEDADAGIWASYYSVHFGYRNSENRMVPFVSPKVEDRKSKMVIVRDAAEDRIVAIRARLEEAKASGDEETYNTLLPLVTKQYFQKNLWHMNAVDLTGKIGLLKVPHKVKKSMDTEIARLKSEGCDPRSVDNGRFFVINRSGKGFQTEYSVRIYQENEVINGKTYKTDKVHVLTSDLISRLESETHHLSVLYRRPTAEQVVRIVNEGAKALDEFYPKNSGDTLSVTIQEPTRQEASPTVITPVITPVAAVAPIIKMAPAQTAPAPAQASTGGTAEDFLKQMGLNNNR